jgi:hypothetical protein
MQLDRGVQGTDWTDFGEVSSDLGAIDDDSDQYLSALTRDEEQEIHSPLLTGFKYVSGGAGEGRQHLSPSGQIPNHPEVKTDEELPSYCDPPNPCPLGFEAEDCDPSPMGKFTGDYSRFYQNQQDCQCDDDHDECSVNSILFTEPPNTVMSGILKRARRVRRNARRLHKVKSTNSTGNVHHNPYHKGENLRFHVAKKSPRSIMF